jgi:hypothetical protein
MSIPSAVWSCRVCGFETDFPRSKHYCLAKNCPHPTRSADIYDPDGDVPSELQEEAELLEDNS